jgi:hypothetical protein
MSPNDASSLSPMPSVVRSRLHLMAERGETLAPSGIPVTPAGVTYEMAQEATWLDPTHFAVGRWDGTLSIFKFSQSSTTGPVITTAVRSPASEGLQMITWLSYNSFVTSNDDGSLVLWVSSSGSWQDLKQSQVLNYDSTCGVANSGDSALLDGTLYLVVGHANGYVTIWKGDRSGTSLSFVTMVNVRSSHPTNPWNLHNVRGVAWAGLSQVVTGSEDGDLCIIQVPSGQILSRTTYNPDAQRGINSISTLGPSLLVANCSVGNNDKNLWYYVIDSNDWSINLRDSTNLRINQNAPQVFNFCVTWATYQKGVCFFSSTEEGALWMGTIINNGQNLSIFGYQIVASPLGAALAFNFNSNYLVFVSYNLYEFITGLPCATPSEQGNPQRITLPT